MSREEKYKKYDHSQVIGRHIQTLSQQASNLEDTDIENWNIYFHEVMLGIAFLDSLLDPFKSKEFDEIFTDELNIPQSKGKQIKFVHQSLKKYFNLLHQEGLFYTQRTGRRET